MTTPQRVFFIECLVCGEKEVSRAEFFRFIPINKVQKLLQALVKKRVVGAKISFKRCQKCTPKATKMRGDVAILRHKQQPVSK